MSKPLIMVSSITYAIKSRDILDRHGIKSYIERIHRTEETGCGYGVYAPSRTDEAENILRDEGIRIIGRAQRKGVS